jgi:hypothetical protein
MPITGYSDRVNHALAYAAKHHDQQVRKGTRLPYFTAPASLAIILTRYGRSEDAVLAGILLGVVEDYLCDGYDAETIRQRVGEKFGQAVLDAVLGAARRRADDDGVDLTAEEQKADALERLGAASDDSRWVSAAHTAHEGGALLSDLRRTAFPDSVWMRFAEGRESKLRWFRHVHDRLAAVGFGGEILHELHDLADALAHYSEQAPARTRSAP